MVTLDGALTLVAPPEDLESLSIAPWVYTLQVTLATLLSVALLERWKACTVALVPLVASLPVVFGLCGMEHFALAIGLVRATGWPSARRAVAYAVGGVALAWGVGSAIELQGLTKNNLSLVLASYAVFFCLVGLVLRRVLHAVAQAQQRIDRQESENAQLRLDERGYLAAELETLVQGGIAQIQDRLTAADTHPDLSRLRATLAQIDDDSRAALTEMRTLLWVLEDGPSRPVPAQVVPQPETASGARVVARRVLVTVSRLHLRWAGLAIGTALALVLAVAAAPRGLSALAPAFMVLALALCLHRLWLGLLVGVAAVAVALTAADPMPWAPFSLGVVAMAATARGARTTRIVAVLTVVGYLAASPRFPGRILAFLDAGLILTGVGIAMGLTVGYLRGEDVAAIRRLRSLRVESRRIPGQERDSLAMELHDVVAHQLTTVNLIILGVGCAPDEAAARAALERIQECIDMAELELTALLAALHAASPEPLQPAPLVTPDSAWTSIEKRLVDHGFTVDAQLDLDVDLDPLTSRTVTRALQECATNILRYASPGTCRFQLSVGDEISVLVASPMPASRRSHSLSGGRGLRGLRERVRLCGGSLEAGQRGRAWVVELRLPRQAPQHAIPRMGPAPQASR